jgi:hypothetical protein
MGGGCTNSEPLSPEAMGTYAMEKAMTRGVRTLAVNQSKLSKLELQDPVRMRYARLQARALERQPGLRAI